MTRTIGLLASLAVLLVGFQGCSVDTPTAPDQVPAPPPTQGGNNWIISVKITPDEVPADGDVPSTVTVDIESRSDGSSPINGTTMMLTTTLGDFGSLDSEVTSVGVMIDRGKATALLFPGEVVAIGTVKARLEGSEGRDTFEVIGSAGDPFITSVNPSTGAAAGGTQVTIVGLGFREDPRVFVGDKLATLISANESQLVIITPPGDMDTESCDGGDGTKKVDTPVDVTLEFADGGAETLSNGFTYLGDGICIPD
jgi:hypothetical protein